MKTETNNYRIFSVPSATGQGGAVMRAAMLLVLMFLTTATAWAQTASTADGWVIQKSSDGTRCRLNGFVKTDHPVEDVTVYPAIIDGAAVVFISLGVEPKDFPNLETVYMYNDFEFNEMSPVPAGVKHIHVVDRSGTVVAEDAIPEGITKIPDNCFNGCKNMEKLTLPDGLKVIGSYAFYGCNALKDFSIPNSVTDIGDHAFDCCETLSSIAIPNGVTTIAQETFNGCEKLENVTIPNSVTSIGNKAFDGCKALTSITIPNNVTTIADYTFHGCEKLENVTIPNSVTSIGEYNQEIKGVTNVEIIPVSA